MRTLFQKKQEMEKELGLPDLEKKWAGFPTKYGSRWVKTGPGSYELEFDKEKFFSIPLKELMREAFSINYTPPPKQPYTPKEEQDSQSEWWSPHTYLKMTNKEMEEISE